MSKLLLLDAGCDAMRWIMRWRGIGAVHGQHGHLRLGFDAHAGRAFVRFVCRDDGHGHYTRTGHGSVCGRAAVSYPGKAMAQVPAPGHQGRRHGRL